MSKIAIPMVLALGLALSYTVGASPAAAQPFFGPYYRSSTPAEGYARGWASIIRSQGQYHLDTSEAAKNFEQARALQLENRYKYTKTYFENKMMNREYRQQLEPDRLTEEQLIRFAQAGKPAKLSDEQLDPYTGKITWPTALRTDRYNEYRYAMQQIMIDRSQHGRITGDQSRMVEGMTNEALAMLKAEIERLDSGSYLEAKRFIQSLAYEARL